MSTSSETVIAVNEALENGIFVVAAAGNLDIDSNDSDVSSPASLSGVIAVGAHDKSGDPWADSASGSEIDPHTGEARSFPSETRDYCSGVLLWSCSSHDSEPPYAYSTGTSDSTVIVTGALALILSIHGEDLSGDDGKISQDGMNLVKVALAKSAKPAPNQDSTHNPKSGYGLLDASEWSKQLAVELGT